MTASPSPTPATSPAAASGIATGSTHHTASQRQNAPCEPAQHTSNGPWNAGGTDFIQSRAARLRHSNAIQRQRFMDPHQTLSKGR